MNESLENSRLNTKFRDTSPTHSPPPHRSQTIVDKGLDIYLAIRHGRESRKWGIINAVVLSILLYDISNKCPYAFSKWFYVEYVVAGLFALSVCYHFVMYFYYLFSFEPIKGSVEQRKLLVFDESDTSFITTPIVKPARPISGTPLNVTSLSWNSSMNDSNRSIHSPSWLYNRTGSPIPGKFGSQNTSLNCSETIGTDRSYNQTVFTSPYQTYSSDNLINDEKALKQYLKDIAQQENTIQSESQSMNVSRERNTMNTFWNYCNNAANMLKTSLYQMSPTTVSPLKQSKDDNSSVIFGGNDFDGNSDVIKKISSAKLSQFVTNLRMWISVTIIDRLVTEINKIDQTFKTKGFSDIKIGMVGLERLKKTAENQQLVVNHTPMLPKVIPFLEMSTNQEYLIQRIRDLAKGSCLGDYRWNSGGSYHGLNWDEHLPTDSAIIFHIFCTYLDNQLMPLPQPGGRPFYNRYVICGDKKSPRELIAAIKNKPKCAILCTDPIKPKFNFISDDRVHNCNHDRNNLFYVIVQFLIYMKTCHNGLLEGINLGKSGINILCVIED